MRVPLCVWEVYTYLFHPAALTGIRQQLIRILNEQSAAASYLDAIELEISASTAKQR